MAGKGAAQRKKAKDSIIEDKPQRETKEEGIGAALQKAVSAYAMKECAKRSGRKDRSPLWNELNALSPYVRREYVSELRRAGEDKKEAREVESKYLKLANPTSMEAYISDEALPLLEAELAEKKRRFDRGDIGREDYERAKSRLQNDIALAMLDLRQLRTQREIGELSLRLSTTLDYSYLPERLGQEFETIISVLKNARGGNRRECVRDLEALLAQFTEFANSPSKAKEHLLLAKEGLSAKKGKDVRLENKERLRSIEADLSVAERHIAEASVPAFECRASGARCRLEFGSFEAISDSEGSRIARLIHKDGSQVAFFQSGEVRVADARGRSAVYREGRQVQLRDAEGCFIQYVNGAKARAVDSEGNTLVMDPGNESKYLILAPSGDPVLPGEKHVALIANFRRLIRKMETEQVMETEDQRLSLSEVLARAEKALPEAEKRLGEFEVGHAGHGESQADIASSICSLSRRLRKSGDLRFAGNPSSEGFEAVLAWDEKEYDVSVLSAITRQMLRDAVRKNHPANAVSDHGNTLAVEVPRMFILEEERGEHPAQYTRILTLKLENGEYASVIALHKDMVRAIISNDFRVVGERIYGNIYRQLKERGHSAIRWKLAWMPNSDVCHEISSLYGEGFLAAMRAKDFDSLGRQEVFDNLVHNVTHAITRPKTRAHSEALTGALNITDEDEKRAGIHIALMFEGKETYLEQKEALVKLYQKAYGTEVPENLPALGVTISELRQEFFRNPTQEAYLAYQKADFIRDVLRDRYRRVNEFAKRARGSDLSEYHALSGEEAVAYREECRKSFQKELERELITNQGNAVDEGLAIAMQRSRYNTRAVPTAFSISIHLQEIANDIGHELVLNELSGEVTPWGLVRRANQLRAISAGYDESFIEAAAKLQAKEQWNKEFKFYMEIAAKLMSIGSTAYKAG